MVNNSGSQSQDIHGSIPRNADNNLSQKRKNDERSPDIVSDDATQYNKRYIIDTNKLIKENRYYLPPQAQIPMDSENIGPSQPQQDSKKDKVPPIYLHNANHYQNIVEDIIKVIENDNFTTHCKANSTRINLNNTSDFRKLTKFYDDNKLEYHTFHNPDNTVLSVVIRNLPLSFTEEEIQDELSKTFTVKKVVRLLNREKNPIPICAVELENNETASKIYNMDKFMHCIVSVEQRRRPKDIPQCTRCQRYGHTKNYCRLQPRCVKCQEHHLYSQCAKQPNEMPSCVNCGGNHSANYKGCSYYTDLKRKINSKNTQTKYQRQANNNDTTTHQPTAQPGSSNPQSRQNHNTRSYASVTRERTQSSNKDNNMSTIFDTLLQFIQPYLDQIKQFIFSLFTSLFNSNFQQK